MTNSLHDQEVTAVPGRPLDEAEFLQDPKISQLPPTLTPATDVLPTDDISGQATGTTCHTRHPLMQRCFDCGSMSSARRHAKECSTCMHQSGPEYSSALPWTSWACTGFWLPHLPAF